MNLLVELGVNRLSVGVQTFNLGLRKMLGRRGGGKEVDLQTAVGIGIDGISLSIL
jgi:coproporphyrinogen III oxidase-like Fe-S oxidoreductase